MSTKVFYINPNTGKEDELPFVAWSEKYLIVEHSPGSVSRRKHWRIGRPHFERLLQDGQLRIEGEIPRGFRMTLE